MLTLIFLAAFAILAAFAGRWRKAVRSWDPFAQVEAEALRRQQTREQARGLPGQPVAGQRSGTRPEETARIGERLVFAAMLGALAVSLAMGAWDDARPNRDVPASWEAATATIMQATPLPPPGGRVVRFDLELRVDRPGQEPAVIPWSVRFGMPSIELHMQPSLRPVVGGTMRVFVEPQPPHRIRLADENFSSGDLYSGVLPFGLLIAVVGVALFAGWRVFGVRGVNLPAARPVTPRRATAEDESALRSLVHDAYAPWIEVIGQRPGPMLDDYAARIAAGQAWITDDKRGAIVLEPAGDSLLIDNVAVAPEAQGKGLGRALVAFAESEARRLGLRALTLYTHAKMESNLAFYERLGLRETHRVTEKGFDRVYMRRDLV